MRLIKLNKSVSRAIDILTLISKSDKHLTLTEIAKKLDIPKSSALDVIQTLLAKDFIEVENAQAKTYRIGISIFTIGTKSIQDNNLQEAATEVLTNLSQKTQKTIFLGVPKNDKVIYVSKLEGNSPVQSSATIGSDNPMHLTGIGKAILAAMPLEEIAILYQNEPYESRTKNSITTYHELVSSLTEIRQTGYAIDDREGTEYIYCFAAPIYNYSNKVVAALSVASLAEEVGRLEQKLYPELVVTAALEISKKLGYTQNKLYKG